MNNLIGFNKKNIKCTIFKIVFLKFAYKTKDV